MELLVLAGAAFAVFALGFIGAPLLRSEDEIQPLYRPRPGVRQLYGPTGDETSEAEYAPLPEQGQIRCLQCGAVSDDSYDYCEECLESLT